MINQLLNEIDVLDDYSKDQFQKFPFEKVGAITPDKSAVARGAAMIDGRWVPKSQLRCDFDGNLYVANWLYDKITN